MTGADYAILAYVIAFSLMLLYGLGIWRQRRRLLRRAERAAQGPPAAAPAPQPAIRPPAATLTAAK